ncbi:MAG: ATP-dependent helicase [Candidatus Kerfeldbacteria bacterium]|nr:ATP-dependent helicase [Candidatus Kerfeldbacteria bacterium]
MDILSGLNKEQQEAVTHESGPLLIIAGAGTGKTTVITRRIAYLIEKGLAKPEEILALTFTEKAAGEMEERVDALLCMGYVDLWISTFHAFGERLLKDHAIDVGLPNDFKLLGETEQALLLREYIDDFELDYYRPKGNPTKFVQALISHFSRLKDEDITPQEYLAYAEKLHLDLDIGEAKRSSRGIDAEGSSAEASLHEARRVMEVARAYKQYQDVLRAQGALDFGDLIIETIHLLKERPTLLAHYRKQFKYILVDEFQDTNFAQYDLIKLLAAPHNNLTVVADDDQSIYSFRGASMSNILIFKKDFPDSYEVSLIQNYRSRQNILDLAYEFIQHNNPNRLEKTLNINKHLQSNIPASGTIEHLHSQTLDGEAKMVADKMIALKEAQPELAWSDFAILVRANDQANTFIPYLERAGIPYQFLASKGLFAKPVILDVIAFLKLLDNYHESRAMYRVLTYTVWNIPHSDIVRILEYGRKHTQSLYESCRTIRAVLDLNAQTYTQIETILTLLDRLALDARSRTVGEITLSFLEQSGYLKWLTTLDERMSADFILYLNQFYKYITAFERAQSEKTVRNFINELTLMIEAGDEGKLQADMEAGPESVKLMTIHAAKGLEFEYVFVVNLVDKRFPSIARKEAIPVPDAIVKDMVPEGDWHIEEERRLFYVAVTRAKTGLFLTSGEDYGGARKKKPSRFLIECGFVDTKPEPTGAVVFGGTGVTVSGGDAAVEDEALTHKPKTFSFTQLKAYETCPWQYRFSFILKVPTPGKPSFSFGKTIHATLYEFFRRLKEAEELQQGDLFGGATPTVTHKDLKSQLNLDTLLEIYEQKWINEWYENKKRREEYYEKGKTALKKFYALHEHAWPRVMMLEKGFHFKLGEYTMKGAIDRVDETEEGIEIIDYKTGTPPKSGKKDTEQLYVYALALREIMELDPIKLTYYFIEENTTMSTSIEAKKLEAVSEWALGLIEKILSGKFAATPGMHCKFCDYRDICEFRS